MAEDKWNVKGLRGSVLEELINYTNEKYRQQKLALVQKIPTSIKPVRFDKTKRHITLAYFDQKSTVDYIGVVQGIPICFDAKECAKDIFPLQNIHEHQVEFMRQYQFFVDLFYSKACLLLYVISGDDEVLESCKRRWSETFQI